MWGWLVAGLSGIIHISAVKRENKILSNAFKPITLLSLLAILVTSGFEQPQLFWVGFGLVLSIVSDLLCLLKKPQVKASFATLLMAFLSYSKAFWLQFSGEMTWWLPALLFATGIMVVLLLLPKLDTLVFPVSIMGLVLVQMTWAASAVWLAEPTLGHLFGCIASFVFIVSTLIRALNQYNKSIINANVLVTAGYFLGQAFVVASVIA